MYLVDFFKFLFNVLSEASDFIMKFFNLVLDIVKSLNTMVQSFPLWLSVPFGILLVIAVLFRVSQFVPTIGGASD